MATTNTKTCRYCNQEKPRECFSKMAASPDGLQPKCKECSRLAYLNGGVAIKAPRDCSVCGRTLPADRFRKASNRWSRRECLDCEATVLRCAKCGELKPHEGFAPDATMSTGRKSFCRACDAAHAEVARKTDAYRENRKEYRKRPEVKAKELAYGQAYFATDRGRSALRKYSKSEKGYVARTRRRARVKQVECTLTWAEWQEILAEHGNACAYCHRPFGPRLKPEQDHRVPISKGGGHTRENVVPACRHCNASKNDGDSPITLPDGTFIRPTRSQTEEP